MIVYAFFAELHRPASGALIADLIPPEHRVAAYAFNRLLFNLSFAIGLALGGLLAEEHFRELFIADAVTSVIFGVISLIALPHGTRTTKEQDREIGSARAAILADKGFLLVLAAILAGGLVYAQGYSTFPLWVRDLGFPERVYGFLQGFNGILVAVFELGGHRDRDAVPADQDDRPGRAPHGPRVRSIRHPPDGDRDGVRGRRLDVRRDVRLREHGGVHRGPSAGTPPGPVSEQPRAHVLARVHDRPDRRNGDLRVVATRPLDRLRGTWVWSEPPSRSRESGTPHPRWSSHPPVDARPLLGYISNRYIGESLREGMLEDARTRGPGSAEGAAHARLPALA